MARVQIGIRITEAAAQRLDLLASEYKATRADVVRALLAEALASQPIVDAARRRLLKSI